MEILGWLWWMVSTLIGAVWTVVWFLVSGWVSTLLQIMLLVVTIYFLKYGWQRAPGEIWRRSRTFGGFFWSWIWAGEGPRSAPQTHEVVRVVKTKEFGDINVSTLLSLLALAGLLLASGL